jgi:hypothetical protein
MQALVAKFPELISEGIGELLLIKREQPVADSLDSSGRWSIDHLFVTQDAVPVLVELKRAVDTRLRREVVGQMLDYAANATAYWQTATLADAFAVTCAAVGQDPEKLLSEFIGGGDTNAFWDQVGSNLKAGRIKLVFVADVIPRELARIVEFLNDQMDADVRAVELRWFSGEGGHRTLSPRVIGETERSVAAKPTRRGAPPPIGMEDWIANRIQPLGKDALAATRAYIRIIEQAGGSVGIPATQGSIYGRFIDENGKKIYPFHLWPAKKSTVTISFSYLVAHAAFADESVRESIYHAASDAVGPLSSTKLSGFPAFPLEKLADPDFASRFESVVRLVCQIGKVEQL